MKKLLGCKFERIPDNWLQKSVDHKSAVHFIPSEVLVFARENVQYQKLLNRDNVMNMPDGMPIKWSLNLLHSFGLERRYAGPDCILDLLKYADVNCLRLFLYGSSNQVLERMRKRLAEEFPKVTLVGSMPGLYESISDQEKDRRLQEIKSTKPDMVFVGLGGIKQECWIAENQQYLNCSCYALGAAFDYFAGSKKRAPKLMQLMGMEWFFRMMQEPKRLLKRYAVGNVKFIFYLFRDLINPTIPVNSKQRELPYRNFM